ncbi:mitochondrial ribosomal protein L54 [Lycorma delicatula]|uniref:mitochondrial ribosomal protein L54 n=1 Tax=Lycorma delicatula TaxID=130591 RepID=UPI003F5130BB
MSGLLKIIRPIVNRIVCIPVHNLNLIHINKYATPSIAPLGKSKKVKAGGPVLEKIVLPVETDTHKIAKFVCGSNLLKEGKDIELKPDNEYPDWLWNLHIGKPKTLEELDPETLQYWRKLRKMGMKKNNRLRSLRKF